MANGRADAGDHATALTVLARIAPHLRPLDADPQQQLQVSDTEALEAGLSRLKQAMQADDRGAAIAEKRTALGVVAEAAGYLKQNSRSCSCANRTLPVSR